MIKKFTFKGIRRVKQIFEQSKYCSGIPIRKLAEKINNYWGYEAGQTHLIFLTND